MGLRITLDSSVIVKWFKKGEEFEEEALKLRDDVLSGVVSPIISEWVYLEVIRALIKTGFPRVKVNEAYDTLRDMAEFGFIEVISVTSLLDKAKELMIELNLYASDAVNLSSALMSSTDILSEDKHLLRRPVRDFMRKAGLKVLRLTDIYPGGTKV